MMSSKRVDPELHAEGLRLFDAALTNGLHTGRYAMDDTGTDIVRGPNFERLPPWPFDHPGDRMGWMQRQIDQMLER
jgi:hypothetical protein